jgi:hypothetical protein
MNRTDRVIIDAYQMQRVIGLRLRHALQEIVEEKLPGDIAALLSHIERRSDRRRDAGTQKRRPANSH